MNAKTFSRIRLAVIAFIAIMVSVAVTINNLLLALAAVFTGIICLVLVRRKVKDIMIDERMIHAAGYAARVTYFISTVILGMSSVVFIIWGRQNNAFYLESLGMIFSYITLFNMLVYSVTYKILIRK